MHSRRALRSQNNTRRQPTTTRFNLLLYSFLLNEVFDNLKINMQTQLSIVIGTRNRLRYLKMCLDSLLGKVSTDHEIIVIDAGSTDGTQDYVRSLGERVRLVEDGARLGQAKSLNRVFKTLNSRYTCWLSDDNVLNEGMIDLSVAGLDHDQEIGMVGLKVKDVMGPATSKSYNGGVWISGVICVDQGIIRTDLLHEIGGFDESFWAYGIDSDLTTQVLLKGFKVVFTREIAVLHYRDHENAPGAMEDHERKASRLASIDLYKKKYADLCNRPLSLRLKGFTYTMLHKLGLKMSTVLGSEEQDWFNSFNGRFVSILDPITHRNDPFYLEQRPPHRALK